MNSIREISANEIAKENPLTVTTDQSVSQIKNKMEEERKLVVPVVNNGKLKGAIGYRDLIRHIQFNPESTNIEKVMHQPPEYQSDDNLIDLADLRINSGEKMLVHTENEELKGIIGEEQFLNGLANSEEIKDLTTEDIGTHDLITIFEDDSIEKARHAMLDNNISRLPVLDQNGNLVGIIHSLDLLKMLVPRESVTSGGTSNRARNMDDFQIAGGIEKEKISEITVREIMTRTPTTKEGHVSALNAVEEMIAQDATEVIIVNDKYPESVVTVKDYLSYVKEFKQRKTVLVNLIGLEVPEEKEAIHSKIRTQLQGALGRKLVDPEEISFRIKKKEAEGTKHRYEVNANLYSEYGRINVQEDGWDMLDITDSILEKFNKIVRKRKGKQQDRNKQD